VAVFTAMSGAAVGGLLVVVVVVGGRLVVVVVVVEVVVGTALPVQATPFMAKPAGLGLLPVHDPLKPKDAVPFVAMAPL
jgi:hypothetical protein